MNRNLSSPSSSPLPPLTEVTLTPATDYTRETERKLTSLYHSALDALDAKPLCLESSTSINSALATVAHYATSHIEEHLGEKVAEHITGLGINGRAITDKTGNIVSYHILFRANDRKGRHYVLTDNGVYTTDSFNLPSFTRVSLEAGKNKKQGGLTFAPIISDEDLYEARCAFRALIKTQPEEALFSDNIISGVIIGQDEVSKLLQERKFNDNLIVREIKPSPLTYVIRCGPRTVLVSLLHENGHLSAKAKELTPVHQKSTFHAGTNIITTSSANDQIEHLYLSTIGTGSHFTELTENEQESMQKLEEYFIGRAKNLARESGIQPDENIFFSFEKPDVLLDDIITTGLCTLGTIMDKEGNYLLASSIGLHKVSDVGKTGVFQSFRRGYSIHPYLSANAYEEELSNFIESVNEGAHSVICRYSILYGMIFDKIGKKIPVHPEDLTVVSCIDNPPAGSDASFRLDFTSHILRATLSRDSRDGITPRIKVTPYQ